MNSPSTGHINAVLPTLGGRQYWADELFFHEWHIQKNTFTGHYRLLDGADRRHAWGSFEQCRAKLDQISKERGLTAMSGRGVLVLHGLFRSASAMSGMARHLANKGGYTAFNVNYPTTQGTVADHAAQLARLINTLDGIESIDFVAHSLGNLVIRHYLKDQTDEATGKLPDKRIGRIVMLGPPNCGAQLAETFSNFAPFHMIGGASASQLSRDWTGLECKLMTPACPFGIIAGGRNTPRGYNPLLGEDNDLIVSVESTRLVGAADFAVLPVLHTVMMDDATVQEYTLRFLAEGCFQSADTRQPIKSKPERPVPVQPTP